MKLVIMDYSGFHLNLDIPTNIFIRELKKKIGELTGVSPNQQRLIFDGTELEDPETIDDYGIKNGSTLYLAHDEDSDDISFQELKDSIFQDFSERIKNFQDSRDNPLISDRELEEYIELNLKINENPQLITEFGRLNDLEMIQCESSPQSFNDLVSRFNELENSKIESVLFDECVDEYEDPTIIPEKSSKIIDEPLPYLFFE